MQLESSINQELIKLIKAGDLNKDPTYTVPGFNVTDIYPIFKHCFSEKAIVALENVTKNAYYEYNRKVPDLFKILGKLGLETCKFCCNNDDNGYYIREFDRVKFICSRSTKDKLHLAVEKVIKTVNHLANRNYTKATLLPLGVLETMSAINNEIQYIVISYITLNSMGQRYVEKNGLSSMFCDEGGTPNEVDNQ